MMAMPRTRSNADIPAPSLREIDKRRKAHIAALRSAVASANLLRPYSNLPAIWFAIEAVVSGVDRSGLLHVPVISRLVVSDNLRGGE